ncbi:YlbL family protein [Bailinhaonella thermotolerans]|uniref:endopeptidase La n=1 Tax=Bailinhaonella thermotolerans TaxID=1070861 RepID=A0A3A4BGA2_9ACTN|nr:PDZ domain-containing protein [Bailinhaonella thermotolerans]RJL33522.1 PDZ domain-containing protein [Bailinhaonella thermotolerans]
MSRRALTLMVAAFLVLALGVAGAFLPVPYVVLRPGPTENTLGSIKGTPLISISGRQTYPTDGKLTLVTVTYQGGPGSRVDLFTALRGWLDSKEAVVPEETIFPRARSVKEVEDMNFREMSTSQQTATAAALKELKIPISTVVKVSSTQKGRPAHDVLKPGDEIVRVDGRPAGDVDAIAKAVRSHKPGEPVRFQVRRGGKTQDLTLATAKGANGESVVGVVMGTEFKFPFDVKISVGDVGGPSAGLIFSLGIIDKLTPGSLTGGKSIAGTGTIDEDGKVGPIGGIQQKMVGARRAGATIFLTPAGNCADAVKAKPDGLRLVKVETLHDALTSVESLREGGDAPSCPAGKSAR